MVICCAVLAAVSASDAQKCTSSPERAVAATERSQAVCMRASAPVARTVSMPESDFDQHAVARGRFRLQPLHRAVERTLEQEADANHERQHDQRDPGERSGDENRTR